MNSFETATARFAMQKNPLVSWEFVLIKFLLIAMLGVVLQVPCGSISGRLALQQEGFNLYSYDMHVHHVYAIAIGPRGQTSQERGVWVNQDGTFKIDQLPVGEYELKVHVPGFATSYDSGIFVDDGKTTEINHDITLQLSNPTINIASNARVFTSREQPTFWANVNGASTAVVNVYKADMLNISRNVDVKTCGFEVSSDMEINKPYESEKKVTAMDYFRKEAPIQTWTREIGNADSEDYSHQEYKFSKPLPPGDYFVVAQASNIQHKRDWNVYWFSVTDLGLVVKQDPEKTVVRALNLVTLQPESGVNVSLYDRSAAGKGALAQGVTGADGFATVKREATDSNNMLVYANSGQQHCYGGYSFYGSNNDSYQTYFYTDRPIYRLGQTMYYKGIARKH